MTTFNYEQYGFRWGPLTVERLFSDDKKGWVTLGLSTPKRQRGRGELQVYVTRTGKIRITDDDGEWMPPNRKR